ncbi:hypothetical protein [Bartonella sp. DGB2]|uniref:hypothetical protein n=1 Tax=Bartonella sp. DGB2 TaxID=3388426 RepID=UPI003990255D
MSDEKVNSKIDVTIEPNYSLTFTEEERGTNRRRLPIGSKSMPYHVRLLGHGIPLPHQVITFTVEGATVSGDYSVKDDSSLRVLTSDGEAGLYLTPTRTGDIKLYAEFMDETSGEHLTAEYDIHVADYHLEVIQSLPDNFKYADTKPFVVKLFYGSTPLANKEVELRIDFPEGTEESKHTFYKTNDKGEATAQLRASYLGKEPITAKISMSYQDAKVEQDVKIFPPDNYTLEFTCYDGYNCNTRIGASDVPLYFELKADGKPIKGQKIKVDVVWPENESRVAITQPSELTDDEARTEGAVHKYDKAAGHVDLQASWINPKTGIIFTSRKVSMLVQEDYFVKFRGPMTIKSGGSITYTMKLEILATLRNVSGETIRMDVSDNAREYCHWRNTTNQTSDGGTFDDVLTCTLPPVPVRNLPMKIFAHLMLNGKSVLDWDHDLKILYNQ